jgi:hypothetical protein
MPRASNILTEHELRQIYERETGKCAIVRGDKFSGGYCTWLEDIVRIWHHELSAMMNRDRKRTVAKGNEQHRQAKLFA